MVKKKKKDRSSSIIDSIKAVHHTYQRVQDHLYAGLKLSGEQLHVLEVLSEAPAAGYSLKQIQSRIPNQTSNTTRLVNKLNQKKLLVKSAANSDKRELRIKITTEGKQTLKSAHEQTMPFRKLLRKSLKGKNAKVVDAELRYLQATLEKQLARR